MKWIKGKKLKRAAKQQNNKHQKQRNKNQMNMYRYFGTYTGVPSSFCQLEK